MNVTEYISLLNQSNAVNNQQTMALERVVAEFPYFQSARALRLRGLHNEDSFRYNYDLKTTAAYTTDRTVLFDYITSGFFVGIDRELHQEKKEGLHDIFVVESEVVSAVKPIEPKINKLEQSILTSIKSAAPAGEITSDFKNDIAVAEEKLEIGKPLGFSTSETHSFQEWLQLSKIQPIEREGAVLELDPQKQKKIEIIDRFIEANPKIPQIKHDAPKVIFEPVNEDKSYLMTETLARVYLEQKKYQRAIQAYEILILKYPEKSSFFADRISDIRVLQQNNNKL